MTRILDMTQRERQIEALNAAFTQKFQSLAGYIVEARPYVRAGEEAALREIEAIAAEDALEAKRLAAVIERLDGIPQVGLHSSSVAELNYLSLEYLLRTLIEARATQLRQYEAFAAELNDDGIAGQALQSLCAAMAAQLDRLRALASPRPA